MTFLLNVYTFQKNDYSRIRQTFQRKPNWRGLRFKLTSKKLQLKNYSYRTEHRIIHVAFYASLLKCLLSDQKIDKSLYAMCYFLF